MGDQAVFILIVPVVIAALGWVVRVERAMISREEYEKRHEALEMRVRELERGS